jgi:chaperonin cofactor prefoldin
MERRRKMSEDQTKELTVLTAIANLRTAVDQRFDQIESRLDALEARMNSYEKRTTPLAAMLEQLATGQAQMQKDIQS